MYTHVHVVIVVFHATVPLPNELNKATPKEVQSQSLAI